MRQGWGWNKEREGEEGVGNVGAQKNPERLPGTPGNIAEVRERSGFKSGLFQLLEVSLEARYLSSL